MEKVIYNTFTKFSDKKVAEYDKSLIGYDTDFASLINKYLLQSRLSISLRLNVL